MTVTREQELWALALWVEREHEDEGDRFIAERVLHFEARGDRSAKRLWMEVARRFVTLRTGNPKKAN